jgi:hypothetical protein
VIPAGDYVIALDLGSPPMAVIRNAATGITAATVALPIRDTSISGDSALLIVTRGRQQVIHSFRVAELGVVFVSDPALAHGQEVREEARKTHIVPVTVAKK